MARPIALPLMAAAVLAAAPAHLVGQERTAVTVDYVGVEGVYLAVGTEDGVAVGDTLDVFAGAADAAPTGRLAFVSVTRRRSVAVSLGGIRPSAGQVVHLVLRPVDGATPASDFGPAGMPRAVAADPPPPARSPSVSGRFSMDVDVRETHTAWSGALFGDTRRRFATPATRLSLTASDLPGGLTLRTSLRASYRYADQPFAAPSTSVRAYELSLAKRFTAVPVELRVGRFQSPYDGYGGYWDGGLVRIGGRSGPGVGLLAGFEPDRANEGISVDIPKVAGFADFAARGRGWRYDTDVSLHVARPTGRPGRRHVGWSQRLTWGPLGIGQRLRYDTTSDTTGWTLSEVRVRADLRVVRGLTLRGTYDRSRPGALAAAGGLGGPSREEGSAGMMLAGGVGSITVDLGRVRWGDDEPGRSATAVATLRAGPGSFHVSGRRWDRPGSTSLSLAPGATVAMGRFRLRVGYGYYDTESLGRVLVSHSIDGRVTAELTGSTSVTVNGRRQWGRSLSGTGVGVGVWRSF